MAMMIEPPSGSPSAIEMALAARSIRTRGFAKKRRNAIKGAKRDSRARLLGPWKRSRRPASADVSPAGVASRRPRRSAREMSQNRSSVWSGLFRRSLPWIPHPVRARRLDCRGAVRSRASQHGYCQMREHRSSRRRRRRFHKSDMQQLPRRVQILHLAPAEPAARRIGLAHGIVQPMRQARLARANPATGQWIAT